MEKNNKVKKTRKIIGVILASILFATTAIGAGFSFNNSINNISGIDNNYNDFIQIETDVKFEKSGKDIKDVSRSLSETLDFLGMQNADVRTMGDSKIIINNPIDSYSYSDFDIMSNNSNHFESMDATDNSNYLIETGTLLMPLFFDGTLDIRDVEGDAAFVNNGSNDWSFVGGVDDGGSFGVKEDDSGDGTKSIKKTKSNVDFYVKNFFDGAKLKHSQGSPVIELQISKQGNNGDGYINMFKDLDFLIDSTANSSNPTQYIFWYNYELTYELVNRLDPSGLEEKGSLFDYVNENETLRPLYVTSGTTSIMSSIYSDTVELTGSYSEKQAQYFVNKINNSNNFSFDNFKLEVIINSQTKIMLIVLASLLLLIILIVIFAFVSYFGLLGVIASAVLTLISFVVFSVFVSTGILITGLGLISMGIILTLTSLMLMNILKIYKNNNEDKFISVFRVAVNKFKEIHSKMFLPLVTTVLLFYGVGMVVSTLIAVSIYLVVIGLVIAYLFSTLLFVLILFLMDILINWTRLDYDRKWDFLVGLNKTTKTQQIKYNSQNNKYNYKTMTIVGTIVTSIMLCLSIVFGVTLNETTGSPINSSNYGRDNYEYVVEATSESAWLKLQEQSSLSGSNPYGADMSQDHFENTEKNKLNIEKAFESNGIKVSSIKVIRLDKIESNSDDELSLLGSFGYQINSRKAIDKDIVEKINSTLESQDEIQLNDEITSTKNKTKFKVSERMSWDGELSLKVIDYNKVTSLINVILALLMMSMITAFILLFVGNWGISLATLISTLMESILIISPLIILFIPFSTISVLPIILLTGLSFINKIIISKGAKNDEVDTDKWKRSASKNKFNLGLVSIVLLILELMLFGIYPAINIIPMIIVTILAPFLFYLIEQFAFVYLASNLDKRRNDLVKKGLERDIENSKLNNGELQEEYIQGVNM